MEKIDNERLMSIVGGFSITGTIINAFLSSGKFIYELGKGFGSAIRRIGSRNLCQI